MRALVTCAIAIAAWSYARDVRADDPPQEDALHAPGDTHDVHPAWGLHSGDTVPHKDVLVYGEIGWPDVSFGFQRGISSFVDIGFRASLSWAADYVIPRARGGVNDLAFGVGFTMPIRFTLARTARASFLAHVDPGIKLDYLVPKPFVGPQIPVGFELGVHVTERTTVTLGADIPFYVRVTPDPTGLVPFLVGVTWEHRFTDRFGVSINARPGVLHGWNRTGSSTDLAFLGQLGLFGRI